MDKKTFEEKKRLIDTTRNRQFKALCLEYANVNNPYKIGDIIRDHCQIIKIESISIEIPHLYNLPSCVYRGTVLTKKLVEFFILVVSMCIFLNVTLTLP